MGELHQVAKYFGDFVAVEAVDLTIGAGKFLTLLGAIGRWEVHPFADDRGI